MRICCFTGRRPKDLYGYDHDSYIPLVEALKGNIQKLYTLGFTTFISGGAQGVDQLAFWAVNALKRDKGLPLNNIVFVPFKGQERIWRIDGMFSQRQYNLMLGIADRVEYLQAIDTNDKKAIVKALYERNHAMVNASELVFGVYPDNSYLNPAVKGGTAECLRFALGQGKKTLVMSPQTLQIVRHDAR